MGRSIITGRDQKKPMIMIKAITPGEAYRLPDDECSAVQRLLEFVRQDILERMGELRSIPAMICPELYFWKHELEETLGFCLSPRIEFGFIQSMKSAGWVVEFDDNMLCADGSGRKYRRYGFKPDPSKPLLVVPEIIFPE